MRLDSTEVNPRRDRERSAPRQAEGRRSALRRSAIEALERRTLMAVLPSPTVSGQVDVSNTTGAEYNPHVAVSPTNPLDLVTVWTGVVAPPQSGSTPVDRAGGKFSTDGGQTWSSFSIPGNIFDPTTSGSSSAPFLQVGGTGVGFDANNNFYVMVDQVTGAATATVPSSGITGAAGAIVVTKYAFGAGGPTRLQSTTAYSWLAGDGAVTDPTLAVDSNQASFSDVDSNGVTRTQTDPTAGNVYVGFEAAVIGPAGVTNFVTSSIQLISSSDGGATFSAPTVLDINGASGQSPDQFGSAVLVKPSLTISQGTADGRVVGGQVTAAWTDTGTLSTASPPETVVFTNSVVGPVSEVFTDSTQTPITDAGSGTPNVPAVTNIPLSVNIADPKFQSLSNLTVKVNIVHPNLDQISIVLMPPTGSGLSPVTLVTNQTDQNGTANTNVGISGANLGVVAANGQALGTVFDDTAYRNIVDIGPTGARGAAAPFIGRFQPEEQGGLAAYDGATTTALNGTWTLQITDFRNGGSPANLVNWSLDFASGNQTTASPTVAAIALRNIGAAGGQASEPITTSPVLASDNTLGAYSQFQGRIYLALVDHVNPITNPQDPADDGDIFLETSDNGGRSWSLPIRVNDDNSLTDGFSESDPDGIENPITGRAQFQPALAVDQTTGTLAVSWLDTRYDASRARTVDMMTTSIDGGDTFSADVYANASQTATDAITGKTVVIGPLSDNVTAAANLNITLSTAENLGLAFEGGHLYPVWSGNQNATNPSAPDSLVDIRIAPSTTAAGPRIVSSTMGPVGGTPDPDDPFPVNLTRAADGTPIANAFVVTFDRPVDPATFTTQEAQVFFRDTTSSNASGGPLPVISVTPLDAGFFGPGDAFGAESFRVNFSGGGVGTYSYTVGPDISDRIRSDIQRITPSGPAVNHPSTNVPVTIPDLTTVTSTLTVSGVPAGQVIADATVNFSINHTFDSDLQITLIAPDGTQVLLVSHRGFDGEDFTNTTLSDQAGTPIASGTAPFTGTFIPDSPLSVLDGKVLNGVWTLKIADTVPFDSGTLLNWSLGLTPGTVSSDQSTGNAMDQDANAVVAETPTLGPISKNDVYASPSPLNGVLLNPNDPTGKTYLVTGPFDQDTLPLIVSGPVVASTVAQNTTAQSAADDLVLNGTTSFIDVTFDRNMNPATITPASVLRITGPSGSVLADKGFPSTLPATAIPPATASGPGAPLDSPISVQDDGTFVIGHLAVQLNIDSSSNAGLTLILVGPDGTQAVLNSGGTGSDYSDTIFDDNSATSVVAATGPYASNYRPIQPLSAFIGKTLAGAWTLVAVDSKTGATATLNNWSLVATPEATITPLSATTYRVSFPTQQLSGSYSVQLASSVQDVNGNALDTNQNAGLALLEGTAAAGSSTPITFPAVTSTPTAIVPQKTIDAPLTVNSDFVIQDLSLTLNITYPNDPDLTATLIAPDGTRIILFSNVGATGTKANFTNTLLKDSAPTLIQNAGPPFFSSTGFKPQQALSTLDGRLSAGTYTLEISNAGSSTGTLNSWSLTLYQPNSTSGLGEPVADQASASFRIFTMASTNQLSNDTWTAVGPAPIGASGATGPESTNGTNTGRIGGIAVDPSDPSGNTVYVGGASGGIWKTTDFLNPAGPHYIPLTNFGPTFAANIGGIAVFPRNGDPNQSIIFAATGEGDTGSQGVGFLRSMDGGLTWTLLDSTDNSLPFASRDHVFASDGGTQSFKILVDPKAAPDGNVIVYAALSGNHGGIWRSLDSGQHWQQMLAGQATDLVFDPASGTGVANGNLQGLYAGIAGVGVFGSTNQGQGWNLLAGGQGNALLQDVTRADNPVTVTAPANTPNGAKGRIVLAKPFLTGNLAEDLFYQGWLYAAVVSTTGNLDGLYLTKDFGANWTDLHISTLPPLTANGVSAIRAVPTNDYTQPNYDVGGGPPGSGLPAQGNYDISLAIDPTNPNITYLGGTSDGQPTGYLRIDATKVQDAHAVVPYNSNLPGGATLQINSAAALTPDNNQNPVGALVGLNTIAPFLNFYRDPNAPFQSDATLFAVNANTLTNNGAGVTWIPFDGGDPNGSPLSGTDQHRVVTLVDPLTGHARVIIGDDQGIWSGVDVNGTFSDGIGTASFADGSRNGNLQITQLYYGAVQPSQVAADVSVLQGLFYGSAQDNGGPASDPNILNNGNITWTGPGGDATGVATDPTGSGTQYQFFWPCCGGDKTNFFQTNGIGRTSGLIQQSNNGPTPDPQWPFVAGSNFAVNPVSGQQIIMSSQTGRLFRTENAGLQWSVIGDPAPPAGSGETPQLDGTYVQAPAFGAPDPAAPAGIGNLDNFLYAGTVAGSIFVTQTGGGSGWINITNGALADNTSPIQAIITDPTRGSHDAYAVTLNGVYFNSNTVSNPGQAAASTWVNITSNLFAITHQIFNDPGQVETELKYLTSIAADWRYAIPGANGSTFPVLYVGGEGGVYRSLDNGATWSPFPDSTSPAGQNGGLPDSHVTDLQTSLGNIDPSTGRPVAAAGDPNVLMASTYGRGAFAIRLAPVVVGSLTLDPSLPPPGGSDSGISSTDLVTNVLQPVIDGTSEISAFGTTVTVNLFDLTPLTPGGPLQAPSEANFVGTATTDASGAFHVQVAAGHFLPNGATDGVKTLGVQAVDQSGAAGNVATITFTLVTVAPASPTIVLDPIYPIPTGSDTGISPTDNVTDVNQPYIDLYGVPPTGIYSLYRDGKLVAQTVITPDKPLTGPAIILRDPGDPAPGGGFTPVPDGTHVYKAQVTDLAGNVGGFSNNLTVTISTATPATPPPPTLDPADDSGTKGDNITNVNRPRFDGSGVPGGLILLIDSSGATVGQATVAANGTYSVAGGNPLQPSAALPDGTYTFRVVSEDAAGALSAPSSSITVTILTAIPTQPTLMLVPADNSGPPGQNVTNVSQPRLQGTGPPGLNVELIDAKGNIVGIGGVITPVGSQTPIVVNTAGAFQLQFPAPLPDGTYVVIARVFDAAGNFSDSAPLTLTIQTQAPTITTRLILNPADVYGVPTAGSPVRTTVRRPVFGVSAVSASGAPAAGTTVDLIDEATGAVVASGVTNAAGAVLLSPAGNLLDGSITLVARALDVAGNLSTASAPLALQVVTAAGDYLGDGVGDLSLFRRTTGQFLITQSNGAASALIASFGGQPGDIPIQGDFDGDGKTDAAFYRPSTGTWYIQRSLLGPEVIQFGQPNVDIPVPADYDGDGLTDIAVYRPTTGQWLILQTQAGPKIVTFGGPVGFVPVPDDYDGDGKADLALYLPSTGEWFVQRSTAGPEVVTFGVPNVSQPVPGDYDGDGTADLGIWNPADGQWIIIESTAGAKSTTLGSPGDVPVPLDYDGDGKADVAVFRPTTDQWFLQQTAAGSKVISFGQPSVDTAIPVAPTNLLGSLSTLSVRSVVSTDAIQSTAPPAPTNPVSLDLGAGASRFSASSTNSITSAIPPVNSAPPTVVPVAAPTTPSSLTPRQSRLAARAEAKAKLKAAAEAKVAAEAALRASRRAAHAHDLAMAALLGRHRS